MLFGFLGKGRPSPCCTPVGPCAHIVFFLKKNSGWGGGAPIGKWKPWLAAEANATPPAAPPGAGRVHFSIKCAGFFLKKTYTLLRPCGAACYIPVHTHHCTPLPRCPVTQTPLHPCAPAAPHPILHAAAHLPPWGAHRPLACMCRCAPVPLHPFAPAPRYPHAPFTFHSCTLVGPYLLGLGPLHPYTPPPLRPLQPPRLAGLARHVQLKKE